jgi:glycosyltransferase involved in cell wall biosynthesis
MPKVSVIIPIYGVEKYIKRCVESLFNQTLQDMEFIFVNDCTKDNSMSILYEVIKEFPERNSQVKIVNHDHNLGLSAARHTGLKFATGDYIAHCDSDDWVSYRMYQELYEVAIEGDYDYVKCGHILSDGEKTLRKVCAYHECAESDKTSVISWLLACKGWNSIWDSIAKRQLYDESVISTSFAMLEDFFLVTQLITKANRFYFFDRYYYYYFINNNSICGQKDFKSITNKLQQAKNNINWIEKYIRNIYGENSFNKELVALEFVPYKILIPIMDDKKAYTEWNNVNMKISNKDIYMSKFISSKDKFLYLLVNTHLYKIVKSIWHLTKR